MPPQDPNSPTPAPGTPPPPMPGPAPSPPPPSVPDPIGTPLPPQPGIPPAAPGPMGHPQMSMNSAPGKKKSKGMLLWIIIAAAVIILGVGGWFGYQKFFAGVKLETYNGNDYSLSIPVGYEKHDDNGATEFVKKGGNQDDNSSVVAFYQAYPQTLTSDELSTVKEELHSQLEKSSDQFVSGDDTLENIKLTDTTFKGKAGFRLTGDVKRDGKQFGSITLVAVTTEKELYIVGVAARTEDSALAKKTDDIINSFQVKD